MQRKPSFPVANCNIKMPDCLPNMEAGHCEDDTEQQQRRQQLINFGHSQWGFNNWNWSVTKQEMDFVDFANGKYCVGVVSFVSITVKSLDLHRENIGYATSVASTKGMAVHKSRKSAVTNALRETLLSFGGSIATELMEANVEIARTEATIPVTAAPPEPPPVAASLPRPTEPKNLSLPITRKDLNGAPPPVARAHPMPVNLPPSVPRVPAPVVAPVAAPLAGRGAGPRNQNDALNAGLESMSEEEARAERKRRQRIAQEEFRQKQLHKQNENIDDASNDSSSLDKLLIDLPCQDIEETGKSIGELRKRKSPAGDLTLVKRNCSLACKSDTV